MTAPVNRDPSELSVTQAMEAFVDYAAECGFPRSSTWASLASLAASMAAQASDDEREDA